MKIGNKEFDLTNGAYIMGILNVTPDSFSDGGKWNSLDNALKHTEEMIKDGAAIIDIGGESTRPGYIHVTGKKIFVYRSTNTTRPGYIHVTEDEEIERVVPYIKAIKERFDVPVSIDTYKAKVAGEAVKAGADLINDIWGFKADKDMAKVAALSNVPCCIMHNRNLEENPYTNLLEDVLADLKESIDIGLKAGVKMEMMISDPGIGFGKSYEDNLKVMNNVEKLHQLGLPILLGTSRKSMIGLTLDLPVTERVEGTVATTVMGVMKGCSIIRVHDVKENYRAMKMTKKILGA